MTGHPGQADTHGSGQMSEAEALAVLNVTQRRPKWLLSQVHPDKHPGFEAEATMATARASIKPWCMDVACKQHACD
jgi:hypothetical protein